MIAPCDSIVRDAMLVSAGERVRFVQDLLDSLRREADNLLDNVWADELDRRCSAWEADPSTGLRGRNCSLSGRAVCPHQLSLRHRPAVSL